MQSIDPYMHCTTPSGGAGMFRSSRFVALCAFKAFACGVYSRRADLTTSGTCRWAMYPKYPKC